ncbi:unnamed protein product [Linum tenue]|uniref:Uncharacterized protein n=1 Tax=Linum tenue TaxID=586396 RepID=A0AAV0MM45_9ROSI|nr:unnamed protein product [Linum tenue]
MSQIPDTFFMTLIKRRKSKLCYTTARGWPLLMDSSALWRGRH